MNPLLLSGFGISIEVNKARLTIKQKNDILTFEPHRMPYDSIVIDGHYGSMSFEAMRWLSKHDVPVILLNWNGNLLSIMSPKEGNSGQLRMKQYEKYLKKEERTVIAEKIIKEKIGKSLALLENLADFHQEINFEKIKKAFSKEFEDFNLKKEKINILKDEKTKKNKTNAEKRDLKKKIADLMMYEGRIASAYWSELSGIFNKIAPEFNFESRKNLSYSWNMNASDPINALLNYGYAILEGMVRKYVNTIGLDPSIGFLHEIAPSKYPLVYDLQELFRHVVDYSVIQILESGLKKSDFIITENYHIRLKPNTARLLIERIKENFNQRYDFRNKKHSLENIMLENIREFSKYLVDKKNTLDFVMPDIEIKRNDSTKVRKKIESITPEGRKKLKINKSTLWYQQKKIKEGKPVKLYEKTKVRIS
ncbi:CRISPR-associated protein Cas1 [uncultured archaeon]|nr:CRISPR-associated protein Cas1 [uncultured archaeon]